MGRPKKIQFFFNRVEGYSTSFTFRYQRADDEVFNETVYSDKHISELPSVNVIKKQLSEFLQKQCSIDNFLLDSINRI